MTAAAREVLADCKIALQMLEDETDGDRWRVLWAGAVALLRTVGHVLDKVDGQDPAIKMLSNASFSQWKKPNEKHEIFWNFIDRERNNILKQYSFTTHPLADTDIVIEMKLLNPASGETKLIHEVHTLEHNLFRPILEGYGAGEDAREVFEKAVEWWDEELTVIENSSNSGRPL